MIVKHSNYLIYIRFTHEMKKLAVNGNWLISLR
jgi:hypothetical protein